MARFRNVNSGAVVDVREGKVLGSEWEPAEATEKKPATRRAPAKKSDDK